MTVAQYLLNRLAELRIRHIFGVPGDFNLGFLEELTHSDVLSFVGCCNELNASYAADGYGRIAGMAALVTTYGVGELSAIAGIAGAYAEKVPIVCINGTPPLAAIGEGALIHHTMADGNYSNMMDCYRNFTVAQALLTPTNASWEIDRVLREGFLQKRPVYLQLPSDVADAEIEAPSRPLSLHVGGDRTNTIGVADLILERLRRSKRPAILADADVGRFGLVELLLTIAERNGLPVAYLISAKGLVPDNNRNVIGAYRGAASSPDVRATIEQSDCLLCIGTRFTDTATGLFTHQLDTDNMINIQFNYTVAGGVFFDNVRVEELLKQIAQDDNGYRESELSAPELSNDSLPPLNFDASINQDNFWQAIQGFLRDDDIIVSDTGTSFFASSRLNLGKGASFLGQSIWAALGYGIPASLGASCATPQRRVLVFVGDGGLQMSVQELSTLFWKNLTTVIFLLNNDGYTIERLIHGPESPYNDIHRWNYAALPGIFETGNHSTVRTVRTNGDLQEALSNSEDRTKLHFIEIILPRLDASDVLVRFAKRAAEFNAPQNLKNVSVS